MALAEEAAHRDEVRMARLQRRRQQPMRRVQMRQRLIILAHRRQHQPNARSIRRRVQMLRAESGGIDRLRVPECLISVLVAPEIAEAVADVGEVAANLFRVGGERRGEEG